MTGQAAAPNAAPAGDNGNSGNAGASAAPTNVAPVSGSPAPVQGSEAPKWYAGLQDAENRTYAEKKGWTDNDAAIKSYREIEARMSAGNVPTKPNPADYQFTLPTDLPQGFNVDTKLMDSFKEMAIKAGMPVDHAKAAIGWYVDNAKNGFTASAAAQAEALNQKVSKTAEALTQDWGAEGNPIYNRNVEMARRAMTHLDPGVKAALTEFGVIVKDADGKEIVTSPAIMKAMAKAGNNMFAEDSHFGAPAHTGNPFDPKEMNKPGSMAAQSAMIKNDPQKAALLIRAAGQQAVTMYANFLKGK